MIVKKIKIKNFRNIDLAELKPSKRTNVIYGSNAQGKTNILESLWLFSGLRSWRTSKDAELIKIGAEKAVLSIWIFTEGRNQRINITIEKNRVAEVNGISLDSMSELATKFCAIMFSPDDLGLISNGPAERRNYADRVISSIYPKYSALMQRYHRAVEQRNSVLKDYRIHKDLDFLLDDFEKEIVKAGNDIIIYRKRFCEKLKQYCPAIYRGLSNGKEEISAEYLSSGGNTPEEFIENLKNSREIDCINLATSVGPHRDDFEIMIDGISARKFASQGQKRSAAITLKLAESEIIEEITGNVPIILLDDVMSELDKSRQKYILNHIKGRQVFITCCDPSNIEGLVAGKVFNVEKGQVL